MHLDVVIPTFNRVKKLMRCLKSLDHQTFLDFEVVVVADNNCQETKRAWGRGDLYGASIICNEDKKLPIKIWNDYLRDHRDCNLVYICDDVELDKDCLANACRRFGSTDKLVGFRQVIKDIQGMCPAAMGIIGSDFADRFKGRQVFCPHYYNMNVDGELHDATMALGKFEFAEDAWLTHYHQGFYKDEQDSVHAIVREKFQQDRDLRDSRKKAGLIWGFNEGLA